MWYKVYDYDSYSCITQLLERKKTIGNVEQKKYYFITPFKLKISVMDT